MAMLSDGAEGVGLEQGLAFGLMNLTWATGQALGDIGGARLGEAAGRDLLKRGIAEARAARVEIALLDQQYYPRHRTYPLTSASSPRWAKSRNRNTCRYSALQPDEGLDAENTCCTPSARDRFHMATRDMRCLGRLVAGDIGRVVGPPRSFPMAGPAQELPGL